MMDEECFDEATLFSTFDAVKDAEQKGTTTRSKKKVDVTSSTELDSLKQENKLLKKVLRKIAPTSLQDNGNPIATIVYFDSPVCPREKRGYIEESIKHFTHETEKQGTEKCDLNSSSSLENRSSFWEAFSLAHGKSGSLQQENEKLLEYADFSGIPVGSVQYFSLFCLDSFGSSVVDLSPRQPSYERAYHKILPDDGKAGVKQRRTCFNCDGDHKLQECQKPRDLVKISAKRQEFMDKFSSPGQEARYHVDKVKKFQHLMPGKVGDGLREALGFSGHEVPPFIYRMRMLGYPPGWLPGDQDSGIVMYGEEGKEEESNGKGKHSNPDQFVQFPGFNVPLPRGVKDLSHEVRLPQMNAHHMLAIHQDVRSPSETASRKRHSSLHPMTIYDKRHGNKRLRTESSETDMELENDSPTCGTLSPQVSLEGPHRTSTPLSSRRNDLEDGEIPDSPSYERMNLAGGVQEVVGSKKSDDGIPSWWLSEPLQSSGTKINPELIPPPFPLKSLPLHKISQILPGEMNHVSFQDRNMYLDPIFGNLQARTGRYDKLKTILANRESKK